MALSEKDLVRMAHEAKCSEARLRNNECLANMGFGGFLGAGFFNTWHLRPRAIGVCTLAAVACLAVKIEMQIRADAASFTRMQLARSWNAYYNDPSATGERLHRILDIFPDNVGESKKM
jgi:hypothetical protein